MSKCMIIIVNGQLTNKITCEKGANLYAALNQAGVGVDAPCGGRGLCGKCLLKATGALSPLTAQEDKYLSQSQIQEGYRLACMTIVEGDCQVEMPAKRNTEVEMSTRQEAMAADRGGRYGAAVDIGTTTVAMYLFDLHSGEQLGNLGQMNKQRAYGADVISRISLVREDANGLKTLQSIIIEQLNEMLKNLADTAGISYDEIDRVTIAGNTTMQHLAAGIDVRSLGEAPYHPLTTEPLTFLGAELGLMVAGHANIEFLGSISGYVGADIVAAILSSGLYKAEQPMLLIDIGTNGEMALGDRNGILCCSTAAGPAFEGAKIRCGCAGVDGAIDEVQLSPLGVAFSTIGEKPPIGICGSALIDVMAQMLESGIVTPEGRMLPKEQVPANWRGIMGETDGEYGLIISAVPPVFIIPKDVREVQLAKAAICAGIYTLCDTYGIAVKDLPKVAIAGGFGAHINKYQAARIGLLPTETVERTYFLGNASGAGAIRALLSKEAMEAAEQVRSMSKYIELGNSKVFQEYYMDCMLFE